MTAERSNFRKHEGSGARELNSFEGTSFSLDLVDRYDLYEFKFRRQFKISAYAVASDVLPSTSQYM